MTATPSIRVVKSLSSLKRPYYVVLAGRTMVSETTGLVRTFADPDKAQQAGRFEVAKRLANVGGSAA